MVNQVPRSFEAFLAESALKGLHHLVDISDVLFKCVQVRRFLAADIASVVKLFRVVILHVTVVRLQIG